MNNQIRKSYQYLVSDRQINPEILDKLAEADLIKFEDNCFKLPMRNLQGEITGWHTRYVDRPKPNAFADAGCECTYFYGAKINFNDSVFIVEGQPDFLSLLGITYNVIGLPGVNILHKAVSHIQKENPDTKIYLLIDNDDAANAAIEKVLNDETINKQQIFDCRSSLGKYHDINDYHCAGGVLLLEDVAKNGFCLQSVVEDQDYYFLCDKSQKIIGVDVKRYARYLIKRHNIATVNGAIYKWNDDEGIRQMKSGRELAQIIIETLEKNLQEVDSELPITKKHKDDIFDFIITLAENDELKQAIINVDTKDICLKDKILNIETGQYRLYSKQEYKTNKFDYISDDIIKSSENNPTKFLEFLSAILEGHQNKQAIMDFLQEYIGYLFLNTTRFEKSILIHGTGANGKGVLLKIFTQLLGSDNYSSVGLHEINKDQNVYLLIGKMANFDFDMQGGTSLDSSNIKKIISAENMIAKAVYRQPIMFVPKIKLVIATNSLPNLENIDNSITRRFVFLELKQSFKGREDFNLKNKLAIERNQIFAWGMVGLQRLVQRGEFKIPAELEQNILEFVQEQDTIQQFIDHGDLKCNPKSWLSNQDIYAAYKIFCKDNGYVILKSITFFKQLKQKGYKDERHGNERGYLGFDYLDHYER